LPPLSELTRVVPSQLRLLLPGFRRIGHPHRRRISLRWQPGKFHRRDSHPLEQQLASLHPYGGFSPVRLQGRNFRRGLSKHWFAIVLRALCFHRDSLLCVRDDALINTSVRAGSAALPQGLSLRSGLFCPSPSSLNQPHPPQLRAHPDFTAWRLIRDAFAVHIRICLGAPRLVLSFHRCSFATCRPLRPRGTLRLFIPSTSPKTLAFNSV
jgi:hypothetical protein